MFSAVFDGSNFVVVGGMGKLKTEVCQLVEGVMKCEDYSELDSYFDCPVFLLPDNYTDSCSSV